MHIIIGFFIMVIAASLFYGRCHWWVNYKRKNNYCERDITEHQRALIIYAGAFIIGLLIMIV